ncbi:MAG: hypothetical protein SGPRY_009906 [Prymnesium sp.]
MSEHSLRKRPEPAPAPESSLVAAKRAAVQYLHGQHFSIRAAARANNVLHHPLVHAHVQRWKGSELVEPPPATLETPNHLAPPESRKESPLLPEMPADVRSGMVRKALQLVNKGDCTLRAAADVVNLKCAD